MKKILMLFLISGSLLTASAQTSTPATPPAKTTTTTTTHEYYYYPSNNVYFDKTSGNYWYKDKPSATTWTQTTTLPSTITVEKEKSYPIEYKGSDPWKNNNGDIKKYKVKKNGVTKIKTKKGDE